MGGGGGLGYKNQRVDKYIVPLQEDYKAEISVVQLALHLIK